MSRWKMSAHERREWILERSILFIEEYEMGELTPRALAKFGGCAYNTVQRHFPNKAKLQRAARGYFWGR